MAGAKWAREAARQLKIEMLERHAASLEELRRGLIALKAQDADELAARYRCETYSHAQQRRLLNQKLLRMPPSQPETRHPSGLLWAVKRAVTPEIFTCISEIVKVPKSPLLQLYEPSTCPIWPA